MSTSDLRRGPGWWMDLDGSWKPPELWPESSPPLPGWTRAADGTWQRPADPELSEADDAPASIDVGRAASAHTHARNAGAMAKGGLEIGFADIDAADAHGADAANTDIPAKRPVPEAPHADAANPAPTVSPLPQPSTPPAEPAVAEPAVTQNRAANANAEQPERPSTLQFSEAVEFQPAVVDTGIELDRAVRAGVIAAVLAAAIAAIVVLLLALL